MFLWIVRIIVTIVAIGFEINLIGLMSEELEDDLVYEWWDLIFLFFLPVTPIFANKSIFWAIPIVILAAVGIKSHFEIINLEKFDSLKGNLVALGLMLLPFYCLSYVIYGITKVVVVVILSIVLYLMFLATIALAITKIIHKCNNDASLKDKITAVLLVMINVVAGFLFFISPAFYMLG